MKSSIAVLAISFVAIAFLCCCVSPNGGVLAITHVTVIDMTGAAPLADQTVLIEKQRIAAVGPDASVRIPSGARTVDGHGRFLIPGLADMHVHLTAAGEPDGSRRFMIPLLLANGITTVRDMGGYLDSLVPLRNEIERGKRIGPRILYAGPYLDGELPSFQPSLVVTNRRQADEDVHQLVARGVDFIKVQSMLSRDAYFAVAEAARREHIAFVGHVPDHITAAEAADAGQRSIEHLTNILRGCSRDELKLMHQQFETPPRAETPLQAHERLVRWQHELLDSYSQSACDALIRKFAGKEVWQTPTLILLKNNAFPTLASQLEADERLKYIPRPTRELWEQGHSAQMHFVSPQESELRAALLQKSMNIVAQMQKAGVKILAGTDSPAPYVLPGFGLHDELELLVRAGLTPMQALQAATRNPAEFLGVSKDSGITALGRYADLVLLDANPLDDIRHTRRIRSVILRGKLLDRLDLDGLIAGELQSISTD